MVHCRGARYPGDEYYEQRLVKNGILREKQHPGQSPPDAYRDAAYGVKFGHGIISDGRGETLKKALERVSLAAYNPKTPAAQMKILVCGTWSHKVTAMIAADIMAPNAAAGDREKA